MSKPIEGVSEKIETCAKKEFLDKGYVDASLRTIAAEAGTTTGSIYSRYGGKEGLFSALVEPAAKEFTEISVLIISHDWELINKCCTYEMNFSQGRAFLYKMKGNDSLLNGFQ